MTCAPTEADLVGLIAHAVRAPSVLNSQPWRFDPDTSGPDAVIRLFADRDRQLTALDPEGRELAISCGAALFYLSTAAGHAGWSSEIRLLPDGTPDLFATVTLRPSPRVPDNTRTFRALLLRRTNRLPFTDEPVPRGVLDGLDEHASIYGATLHPIAGENQEALAALVEAGVLAQADDPTIVKDILAWLRPEDDPRADGVRDEAQGVWDRRAALRTPPIAVARYKRRLMKEAPVVFVLSTPSDTTRDWLRTGQALASVLVHAADRGLAASYANEPIEVDDLRPGVAVIAESGVPQVLFRLGFPQVDPPTPRRSAHAVTE